MYQGLIIFLLAVPSLSFGSVSIKVRVAKELDRVSISGTDISREFLSSKKSKFFAGKKRFSFNCTPALKDLKLQSPLKIAQLKSKTGVLSWNNSHYRGSFQLISAGKNKGCDLVNELSLETYISSLLAKEMSSKWPIEALKAQAVAARSYAYHKKITKEVSKVKGHDALYDLENSEKHQVTGSFLDATYKTTKAARQTSGQILTLKSGYFTPIFFHSKCGGKTLRPDQVWTSKVPGYKSVDCPYCHKHGLKDWTYTVKKEKLVGYLEKISRIFYSKSEKFNSKDFKIVPDSENKTSFRVYNKDRPAQIQKSKLRQVLGRRKTPSNNYQIVEKRNKILLKGKGFGHGVGMCQYGAYELAKRGMNYKEILAHYFPEHVIKKLY